MHPYHPLYTCTHNMRVCLCVCVCIKSQKWAQRVCTREGFFLSCISVLLPRFFVCYYPPLLQQLISMCLYLHMRGNDAWWTTDIFICRYVHKYICIYIYIYMYIYIYIYIHIYMYTCIHIFIYIHIYICIYMYTRICTHAHLHLHMHVMIKNWYFHI